MSLTINQILTEKQNIRYHFEYDENIFSNILWSFTKPKASEYPCYETVYIYRDNKEFYNNPANIELQAKNWKLYIAENL